MQRMGMAIHKHGVPDTYIYLSNFLRVFACVSCVISCFYENYCLCPLFQKTQHATKSIDAKRKFMELMMRKPLCFCKLVRVDDVTPS